MKTSQYIAMAVLALGLAACSNEENLMTPQNDDAVRINATIVSGVQTRVSEDGSSFSQEDIITVQNLNRTANNKGSFRYYNSNWDSYDGSVAWASGTNTFQAWYPADANYSSFSLPADQSSGWQFADWMTAETTMEKPEDPANTPLGLTFRHKLTKVTIVVTTVKNELDGSETVSDPIIAMPATQTVEGVTLSDGATVVTPCASGEMLEAWQATAIIIPGSYAEDAVFMAFKIDENNMNVLANITLQSGLEAGKHYTIKLSVGKNKVTIESVTAGDFPGGWSNDDESELN